MSTFHVTVLRLDAVEPHPNADKLELAVVGGYRAVVAKGRYTTGQPVIYIPSDSIVPAAIAEQFGISAYLAGGAKNRVKAIHLRGVLSEGIVLPLTHAPQANMGDHLEETFGITKYEEPVPTHMNGTARPWPSWLPKYDVENIKHPEYRSLLVEGEHVCVTEKLHGTNIAVAFGPGLGADETAYICSRGRALVEDSSNLYWVATRKYALIEKMAELRQGLDVQETISLHGEVLGCQDLRYGHTTGSPGFAAFDIRVDGAFLAPQAFFEACRAVDIASVPVVHEGAFAYAALAALTSGTSAIAAHLREGVVVKPVRERYDARIGRVVVKYISEEYLRRSEGTEYR